MGFVFEMKVGMNKFHSIVFDVVKIFYNVNCIVFLNVMISKLTSAF